MKNVFLTVTTQAIVGTVALTFGAIAIYVAWHAIGNWIARASAKLDADITGVIGPKKGPEQ